MNKPAVQSLFSIALFSVAFTLPLNIYANSITIILLSLAWLLEGNFPLKWKLFRQRPVIIVFILFYALFMAGMLYTSNMPEGRFNLEKKLSFLVLPLVLGTSISINEKRMETALTGFVASCLIGSFICLFAGLYRFFIFDDPAYLFYMQLSSAINSHAIYFAMYLCFSIFILIHFIKKNHDTYKTWQKVALFSLILFFVCFIFLLTARTVLVFIALFFTIIFLSIAYRKEKLLAGIFAFLILAGAVLLLSYRIGSIKERFTQIVNSDFSLPPDGKNANGLTVRLVKWRCSWEGIKEHYFTGTGTGDATDYLVECYKKKNFWGQYEQYRFNSHNQYLQTGLTLGIPGLICFLLLIFLPSLQAFRQRNIILLSFLSLFCFCCLTESMLERHQGIVFFTFFISLLAFHPSYK